MGRVPLWGGGWGDPWSPRQAESRSPELDHQITILVRSSCLFIPRDNRHQWCAAGNRWPNSNYEIPCHGERDLEEQYDAKGGHQSQS